MTPEKKYELPEYSSGQYTLSPTADVFGAINRAELFTDVLYEIYGGGDHDAMNPYGRGEVESTIRSMHIENDGPALAAYMRFLAVDLRLVVQHLFELEGIVEGEVISSQGSETGRPPALPQPE